MLLGAWIYMYVRCHFDDIEYMIYRTAYGNIIAEPFSIYANYEYI